MKVEAKDKKQMNFFQRLKKSIFELEDYGFFLGERLSVAFKYLFLLIVLISFLVSCTVAFKMTKILDKGISYIEKDFPEFNFSNNTLEAIRYEEGYDEDFDFKIIVDTNSEISNEKIKEYKNKLYDSSKGVILLNDKFIFSFDGSELEDSYKNIMTSNVQVENENELKISNKQELIAELNKINVSKVTILYSSIIFVVLIFVDLMFVLSDVFILTILGLISAKICGVNFKIDPMMTLSIYALTLPLLIDMILDIVLLTTGFNVPYFEAIRMLIAYIYVIAAIFMIKYDLIKQKEELQKIIEVQKQVKEEIKEEKIKDLEEQKEDKPDSEKEVKNNENTESTEEVKENREPDGSEI